MVSWQSLPFFDYVKAVGFLLKTADVPLVADPDMRDALKFKHVLEKIPIHRLSQDDQIAGEHGALPGDTSFDPKPEPAAPPPQKPATPSRRLPSQSWSEPSMFCVSLNHTTLDYEAIITKGLRQIADESPSEAHRLALMAACDFAGRYADELGFEACRHVPEYPARNFQEALQVIVLANSLTGIAEGNSYYSMSLGSIDQYLLPTFQKETDRDKCKQLLKEAFVKILRYGDKASTISLGGLKSNGVDRFNDLTRLCIEVIAENKLPAPLLAVRIHDGTSDEDLDSLLDPRLLTMGQPTFYGENSARRALEKRGTPPEDIERWCVNSCMGLMVEGREFSDMWAIVHTALPALEAAINGGRDFGHYDFTTNPPKYYDDIWQIMDAMADYDRQALQFLMDTHDHQTENFPRRAPFTSALLFGGTPGKDRLLGGPKYHTANVDIFGLVNASDALAAIDELVFKQRKYTLGELVQAAKDNWKDNETLRLQVLACPKFGNGDPLADEIAAQLANQYADLIEERGRGRRMIYMPSFHTLNNNVVRGANYPASLDGRRHGDPFAKNVGPTTGRSHRGITGIMQSAAAIDQARFYGGQALDIYLEPVLYDTREGRQRLRAAIRGYLAMGGIELQVNAVDVAVLEDALVHPERHNDLMVRIGGYSHAFNALSHNQKLELIQRFKHSA
jgi:pyruvate-formate lyase